MAIIGIDLGTTNSLAVVYRHNKTEFIPNSFGDYLTPSVVYIQNNTTIVGKIAKEKLITEPNNTVQLFKRAMGDTKKIKLNNQHFLPEELSAFVVKQLIEDAQTYLGEQIEEVVISVPAYFNDKQRHATKRIGDLLDIKIERLINEPSAAALACHQTDTYETFVVFDFGGGTLDVSIVDCFENVVSIGAIAGNNFLGGSNIDDAIARFFCSQHALAFDKLSKQTQASLLRAAEHSKIYLSTHDAITLERQLDNQMYTFSLTQDDLLAVSLPILENVKPVLLRAMTEANLNAADVDKLVLVGGSSKMPIVKAYLSRILSIPVTEMLDSDLLVAKGLGSYIAMKQRADNLKDLVMTDICPFSLSLATSNPNGEYAPSLSSVIIPKQSVLPISKRSHFSTSKPSQKFVDLQIYQGEAFFAKDNLLLGQIKLPVPNPQKHIVDFEVTYSYDINALLYIEIYFPHTNDKHAFALDKDKTLNPIHNQKALDNLKAFSNQVQQEPEYEACLERANRIYAESSMQERDYIGDNILRFANLFAQYHNNIKRRLYLLQHMTGYLDQLESQTHTHHDLFNDMGDDF